MVRSSKSVVVARTATAILLGMLAAALQPCLAQTANSGSPPEPNAVAVAVDRLPSAGASSSPESSLSQSSGRGSGTSAADRIRTFRRYAPIRESWTTINLGTKYVRGVFGGLEQGASIGLGVQFTTADIVPGVELRATLLTSAKLYRRFQGEVYVPKVVDENTHANLWFDYLRRTKDNFFGIGPTVPKTSMTNYDIERRSYNASLYHNFGSHIVLGGYATISNSATYTGQRDTDTPIDQLFSGDPNVVPITAWAPGLKMNTRILSYGAFAQYDLRNNAVGLTKGAYFYGRIGSNDGLENKGDFSDYGWLVGEMDARGYIPLGTDKTVLALRGFALLKNPRGGSQIPFYDLSYLGGRMYVRGFLDFRFRGNNAALASAELRQTVWTQREDRGLDVFAFGDAGQVWGDNRSTTDPAVLANQDFSSSNYHASVGGGLQYRYSRGLAGRLEIGHSHERNLIYFSISRGF
jgi:hypothetical protein